MSARRQWTGLVLSVAILALIVASWILQLVAPVEATADLTVGDRVAPLTFALFTVVAAVLAWRRPDHVFSWLMIAFAFTMSVGGATSAIVEQASSESVTVDVAAWLGSWSWVAGITILGMSLTLFPDGRLPSPGWRNVLRLELTGLGLTGALAISLWPHRGPQLALVGDQWPGVAGLIGNITLPVVFIGFFAGLLSVVVRYRTGSVIVRLQLKWLILAVALFGIQLVLAALSDLTGFGDRWWYELFGVAGLMFLPIAIALAILRYRLFEIDRIISRTVSYALLTAVLVGVYALGVLGIGALLPGESSDLLVAASTLAVAALFRPLRAGIQSLVDRRFNRARFDAAQTLQAFGARLRDEVDLETLSGEMTNLAAATFQPRTAGLWLPGEATT